MFRWATAIVNVAASIFFTEYWLYGRWPRLWRLLLALLVTALAGALLGALWEAGAFPIALLLGQGTALLWDLVTGKKQSLGRLASLQAGLVAALLPLCVGVGDLNWQYAMYQALLLLCAAITPMSAGLPRGSAERTADEKKWFSILPCAAWLPAILLAVVRAQPLAASTVLLLFYVGLIVLQHEIESRREAEAMNRAMSRWQKESRDYMNTIRSQRHDLNLHLHAINGLIRSNRYEECRDYVERLVAQANDVNDIMPVHDPVVGSMLYTMREEARRRQSDITYYITYDMEDILCNGFECNKIIGNLLQNAIDALQTPEDKAYGIRLRILKRRGHTVILCENRFTGDPDPIARVFEPGYSTKKGHEGIGLSMVQRTVQRYGGRIYPEFEEDVLRFVVSIPNKIRLPEEEKE